MKRQLLCGTLAALTLMTSASAYTVPHRNESGNIITHETANCDPQAQAEMLKELGLFLGTDKGFELDRAMTRAEAAALLCRFLGGEAEAASGAFSHPFADVPAWASNAVGWLYQNKLTYGVSAKQYGANQPVTAGQYAAFLSRALGGDDLLKDFLLTDHEEDALNAGGFRRSHAVAMSVRALMTADPRQENRTLARQLVDKGVFTAEQLRAAARNVIPPQLDYDGSAVIAGVPYGNHGLGGKLFTSGDSVESELSYFYALRVSGGQNELYRVDWDTLTPVLLDRRAPIADSDWLYYIGTLGGKDYLLVRSFTEETARLYSVTDSAAVLELSETDVGHTDFGLLNYSDTEKRTFHTETGTCVIDASGVRLEAREPETTVLYEDSTGRVEQTVYLKETVLSSIRSKTGETVSRFTIPHDTLGSLLTPRTVAREDDSAGQLCFAGEGGLYRYAPETGELTQLFDTAVHKQVPCPNSNAVFYLTHGPDKRIIGKNACGGDTIVLIDHDSGARQTLIDASAGLSIAGFTEGSLSSDGSCKFFSAADVGMQHFDQCFYAYDSASKKITVLDYEAGRPEVMTGWDYSDPSAYKKPIIEQEQARLDAAWNNRQ